MIKNTFLLMALFFSGQVFASNQIIKVRDANGNITYTNLSSFHKGHIIKTFDEKKLVNRITITRPSLAGRIDRYGDNSYRYRSSYQSGSIFGSFSDRYSTRNIDKSRFTNIISDAASRNQVDEKLVHAVIQTESAYNPSAVSRAGAVGLMQLMPATARRYGVTNRTDPAQNVDAGTRYLRDLLDMFNYNLGLAVAAYNAGEGAVMKYNYSIPPYPETRNYVKQVLARYNHSL
jgi:soluble lytic murein transglycosylase-like protein